MDTYPTKREKEHHRLKMPFWGDMLVSWRVKMTLGSCQFRKLGKWVTSSSHSFSPLATGLPAFKFEKIHLESEATFKKML